MEQTVLQSYIHFFSVAVGPLHTYMSVSMSCHIYVCTVWFSQFYITEHQASLGVIILSLNLDLICNKADTAQLI